MDDKHVVRPECIASGASVRLAPTEYITAGDEGIHPINSTKEFENDLVVYHYGFIRDPDIMVDHSIAKQELMGSGGHDQRLDICKKEGKFMPELWYKEDQLIDFNDSHPKYIHK